MDYDAIIVGGGLSGLTAASLLAKRHLKVAVIDKSYQPGGSCGVFKRKHVTFDQGSAMLYGFGENGFNAHRFVFNCLEEPIDMIQALVITCELRSLWRLAFYSNSRKHCSSANKTQLVRFRTVAGNLGNHYAGCCDLAINRRSIEYSQCGFSTPDCLGLLWN